ncbi:MAG: hypothetical protein UV73_C0001G0223 [Candidatus Gottesmanbacteria bacterium GW2011_GWA2_43_14]|uniref:Uncharacterized protein n=1 Tax=Candidatus Gottesmanbacteria bacterium GW2011_GWA2_43_14 TaxID=1618443 RepID=A0A0G1DMC9_9BACT|nr:MAG: hypothetical protein UV73_C0001G0223 [Candidatus Gottesmanbacteria bacterium GW2011_GWA2_43_14]
MADIILSGPDTSEINRSDQEFTATCELQINSSDGTLYYLRGAFFKEGTAKYCGYTWNGQSWFKGPYSSADGWKQLLPVTIASGSAKTEIKARIDPEDSDCRESGEYLFKIIRYTESGSSADDGQSPLKVVVALPTKTPTTAPMATAVPGKTKTAATEKPAATNTGKPLSTLSMPSPTITVKVKITPTKIVTATATGSANAVTSFSEASVAGISSEPVKPTLFLFLLPAILSFFLAAALSYRLLRRKRLKGL